MKRLNFILSNKKEKAWERGLKLQPKFLQQTKRKVNTHMYLVVPKLRTELSVNKGDQKSDFVHSNEFTVNKINIYASVLLYMSIHVWENSLYLHVITKA